jgi:cell division protein FtsB
MSFVLRAKKKTGSPIPATGLWVLIGIAAVFFLVRYGTELLREHDLREQARQQAAVNSALRDDNARLRSTLFYYQSDRYVEQRAREDLNLRRADESVLIPITVAAPAPAVPASTEQPAPLDPNIKLPPDVADRRPGWERWLDLFAPSR